MGTKLTGQSGSYQTSTSQSGEYTTPEQEQRIRALYPQLAQRFQEARPNVGGNSFLTALQQIGGPRQDFGQTPDYPTVTTGPIWDQNQVQGRVNQAWAQTHSGVEGGKRDLAQSMAGRGFGMTSPLYQQLAANIQAQGLAGGTKNENDLRWTAAEGNAGHLLQSQLANVGRTQAMSQDQLARAKASSEDDLRRRQLAAQLYNEDAALQTQRESALAQALSFYNRPRQQSTSKSEGGSYSYSYAPTRPGLSGATDWS